MGFSAVSSTGSVQMNTITSAYQEYVQRTQEIRRLSSPSLEDINDAQEYMQRLRSNFIRIGELAAQNRAFLEKELFPVLSSKELLETEQIERLDEFGDALISAENASNLDLSIASLIEDRLTTDADQKSNLYQQIRRMDAQIGVYYELMNMTVRISAYPEIADHYRKKGLALGDIFWSLLEPDTFAGIEDMECRQMILTDARYSISFYEGFYGGTEINEEQLRKLERMLAICDDPFYISAAGDYDWIYHRFRVLQYYALASERNNAAGFTEEQIQRICGRAEECLDLWTSNEAELMSLASVEDRAADAIVCLRNRYYAKKITKETFRKVLLFYYQERTVSKYDNTECYSNLMIPMELISLMDRDCPTERDKQLLYDLYQNILSYLFHMPNGEALAFVLEFYAHIYEDFREVSSGISFEEMILMSMAAMHPPTFVHSRMVGKLTECLCMHLIRLDPEKLLGVLDCRSAEEVRQRKAEIINFAYHAALCHDAGKPTIIDTVFIYGRKLLDMEFDIIKTHPKTGYNLLMRHESTRRYAEVALGHHKWYDNSRGYPEDFNTADSPVKPIIDLVLCADCLDAATDIVGRSYNRGKSLSDFIGELEAGSGTHYAPWLPGLLRDEAVAADLEYLLQEGRSNYYQDMYYLLRDMHERDVNKVR